MKTVRWLAGGRWLVLMLWLLATAAFAEQPVPAFKAYVTDETGTLTAVQKNQLEQKLRAFTRQKGSQIAVLIVPTTQPETIEQYSMRVAESWKPGRKGVDDGVLFVLAKNDRKFRIEVGYGLEGVLPDAISKRIDSEVIKPYFRKGDFYGGINAGIDSMIQTINQEKLPAKAPASQPTSGVGWLVFIGAAVMGFALRLMIRPVYAAWSAGLLAALSGGIIGSPLFGFVLGLLAFALVFGVSYLLTMMKRAREEKPALATSPPGGSGYGGYTGTSRSDEGDHGFATGLGTGIGLGSLGSGSSDSSSGGYDSSSSSDFGSSGGDFGGGGGGDFGGGGASDSF